MSQLSIPSNQVFGSILCRNDVSFDRQQNYLMMSTLLGCRHSKTMAKRYSWLIFKLRRAFRL